MEKLEKFKNLGLSDNTLKALKKRGFEEPTPIQEKVKVAKVVEKYFFYFRHFSSLKAL